MKSYIFIQPLLRTFLPYRAIFMVMYTIVCLCILSILILQVKPYFFVFKSPPFGAFLLPTGLFLGWGLLQKLFRAYLHRLSTLVLEVKCYLFVITSAPFWASFAFLGPHWTIYEVWIRLKKKNLVFEVKPLFFFFYSTPFGALFGPCQLILEVGVCSKLFQDLLT